MVRCVCDCYLLLCMVHW